jgi:hypothetical protein
MTRIAFILRALFLMLALALAAALVGGTFSLASASEDPFKVPREKIVATVHTVAIAPVTLPKALSERKDVPARFEALLAERVKRAGFSAIPSDSYAVARRTLLDSLGPVFSPVTGKPDSAKARALGVGVRERMRAAGADAILYSQITSRRAEFSGKKVKWDGASEEGGQDTGFVDWLMGYNYSGSTVAYSLVVRLEDLDGTVLYQRVGGIQLASRIENKEFVDVPVAQLFQDTLRNTNAVETALKPLAEKR